MPKQARPSAHEIAAIFAALSQETRLEAYRLLLRYMPFGLAAGDLSRLLSVPHNTLSTHLRVLEAAGLVRSRKQGRSVIFVADDDRFKFATDFMGTMQQGRQHKTTLPPALNYPSKRPDIDATGRVFNVLILCSGNSARSLMAEAIVNRESGGRVRAYSAGSAPKRKSNPLAIELLDGLGYETSGLRPKSWAKFTEPGAPEMDFVITVCDKAAGEACPSWPGHPLCAHWGVANVAELTTNHIETQAAFQETYRNLMNRFTAFINLPMEKLSIDELKREIRAIGLMPGATEKTIAQAAA